MLLETLIVAIAVIGSALYKTGEVAAQPYEIIPYTARHGLPALMGALLLGAVFAKVISTASNYLFSPARISSKTSSCATSRPSASNKRVLIVSRLAVVLLGCWALYQAIYAPSILAKMLYAYTIYSAAVTPVVLAAFYSKRATAVGRSGRHRHRNRRHAGLGRARREGISSRPSSPNATPSSRRSLPPSPRSSSSARSRPSRQPSSWRSSRSRRSCVVRLCENSLNLN